MPRHPTDQTKKHVREETTPTNQKSSTPSQLIFGRIERPQPQLPTRQGLGNRFSFASSSNVKLLRRPS